MTDHSAYYCRHLYIYNFMIVEGNSHAKLTKDNVFSYVWTEHRQSERHCVQRCEWNFIVSIPLPEPIKSQWKKANTEWQKADGCGGQNKNSILLGMLAEWLYDTPGIEKVEIVFTVTGHSLYSSKLSICYTRKKCKTPWSDMQTRDLYWCHGF